MSVTRTSGGGIILDLPFHLGFSMIWDSFKCALKSARRCGPGSIRADRIKVARDSAQLMISLTGGMQLCRCSKALLATLRWRCRNEP